MKPKILLLLIFLSFTITSALKAQDIQTKSVDPAPFNPNIVTPGIDNSQMIGSRYWTFVSNGSSLQFGKGILESCSMTNLGSPFTGITPGALANKNGTLLMNNQSSPFQVYAIDTTTGGQTLLFSCTGVPQANMTGMTWDLSTSTLYGISTSLTVSQIFTINTTTGVCTPIGSPSTVSPEAVFICSNYAGRLFSADVINDNFYRWNKVTGAPGLIGPLGIGLSGLDQDAAFDFRDGNLYVIAHTGGASQLYRVDTNGVSTSLCSFTGQAPVIAINAGGPEGIIHNQNEVPKKLFFITKLSEPV